MKITRATSVCLMSTLSWSCGSSPSAPGAAIRVAGAYTIHKVTLSDTCGGSQPGSAFDNPGEVRQQPGSLTFVLDDHGTRDLPGTLNRDGSFTLSPSQSLVQNTIPAIDTFDGGRFTTQGFEVRDTTDLQSNPVVTGGGACRVVTSWTGTKQGAPNVIP